MTGQPQEDAPDGLTEPRLEQFRQLLRGTAHASTFGIGELGLRTGSTGIDEVNVEADGSLPCPVS